MQKKKHVCVDARLFSASGIGTFLKAILFQLEKNPHFFTSVLHLPKDKSALLHHDFQLFSVKSPIYSWQEQWKLCKTIPKCDLFWSPHFNVPLFPIQAKKRLVTIHDTFHLTFFENLSLLQKIYAKCFYNAACMLSDSVTTVSDFSKKEILTRCCVRSDKIKVIKLGANSIFKPLKKDEKLHNKFHLPHPYVLAVTNYKPHKNFQRIVEACKNICPLVVVGEKKEMEGVMFTGFVEENELSYLYSHAEALMFPSLYEGYGLPPMEAMKAGCPVIVSREGSLSEICEDAAEYVDAYDVASIRNALQRLLKDSAHKNQLIQKGIVHANRRTLETAAREFLQHAEELLQ